MPKSKSPAWPHWQKKLAKLREEMRAIIRKQEGKLKPNLIYIEKGTGEDLLRLTEMRARRFKNSEQLDTHRRDLANTILKWIDQIEAEIGFGNSEFACQKSFELGQFYHLLETLPDISAGSKSLLSGKRGEEARDESFRKAKGQKTGAYLKEFDDLKKKNSLWSNTAICDRIAEKHNKTGRTIYNNLKDSFPPSK